LVSGFRELRNQDQARSRFRKKILEEFQDNRESVFSRLAAALGAGFLISDSAGAFGIIQGNQARFAQEEQAMTLPLPCPPALSSAELERLEREFVTYRRKLPSLLANGQAGRFALIREDRLLGVWETHAEASAEGRRQFGLEPITVKKIDPRDVERLAVLDARSEVACRVGQAPSAATGRS
jgi:hypothetical protein